MGDEKRQAAAAAEFARRWAGRGYERGDSQVFWIELLTEVFAVENPDTFVRFEERIKADKSGFIDAYIPSTRTLIEQKSLDKDLRAAVTQGDGSRLTPFQQAKRYAAELPYSQRPRWIVTCNFAEFLVYDMERPADEPEKILLADLDKEWHRLRFLVDLRNEHLSKEVRVSMRAGEIIGEIHDALLEQYGSRDDETLRMLNILCVRLVFCLYAEDAGIFAHDQFHDYLAGYEAKDMRAALLQLFDTLNTPTAERSRYLRDELSAFPYTNGGLFAGVIDIPQFTPELAGLLLQNASLDFDWSEISPTIFGAVFESTLNPTTRRTGGMHYTSIENIHKVIDPLFMDALRAELDDILREQSERTRARRLEQFHDRLAELTFLDPACGSGNFLTETYLSLRRLENEVIRERHRGQAFLGLEGFSPIKVSINQFHGIEINDFAVTVAQVALWISEAQMLAETERIIRHDINFLPLKSYANIREGNALRMDWDVVERRDDTITVHAQKTYLTLHDSSPAVVQEPTVHYRDINLVTSQLLPGPKPEPEPEPSRIRYDYIIGNPPFVGARMMPQGCEQKKDILNIFGKIKDVQDLDYVCCWYKKAAMLIQGTDTRVGFVATNSICQGSQVPILWNVLINQLCVKIHFAYQAFRWDSESSDRAAVHCVIIGFGMNEPEDRLIFQADGTVKRAENISPYLLDGPNAFAISRKNTLCDVPRMSFGNQPRDGGHLVLTAREREQLAAQNPDLKQWIRPYMGAEEFIKQRPRYCLWLKGITPAQIKASKILYDRVQAVREFRLASAAKTTQGYAKVPHLFAQITQPEGEDYLLVPSVSSERRNYVPIGFIPADVVASNAVQIIPGATLFHFGVLTSSAHMAWMRAVGGRLEMRYRYSKEQVYNTFPWPDCTPGSSPSKSVGAPQQAGGNATLARIEATARAILDARALYPDSSLADLYDEVTMPPELRGAHRANDRAVLEAYGLDTDTAEADIVAHLFARYETATRIPNS